MAKLRGSNFHSSEDVISNKQNENRGAKAGGNLAKSAERASLAIVAITCFEIIIMIGS